MKSRILMDLLSQLSYNLDYTFTELYNCKYLLQSHEIHFYRKIRHCSSYICILSSNTYVRHYVNIYMKVYIAVLSSKEKKLLLNKKRLFTKKKKKSTFIYLSCFLYMQTRMS